IVTDGLAIKQIIDLYNDWHRLHAGINDTYQVAVLETLTVETGLLAAERAALPFGIPGPYELSLLARPDIIIDNNIIIGDIPTGIDLVKTIAWKDSSEVFTDDRVNGAGILTGGETITVTG